MKITSTAPRIKLYIDIEDKDERNEKYKLLDKISYELRNVRNDVMRNCITRYEMRQKEIPVPHERLNGKEHTYNTFNTLYSRDLKYATKTLASWTRVSVEKKFGKEIKDYLKAKRSIPTFKDQNIIIKKMNTELLFIDGEYVYKPAIIKNMGIQFKFVNIEKDKSVRSIIDRILSGEYKMCDHFMKKDGKFWYLYMVYSFEKQSGFFDENTVVGIDVGYVTPAVCAVNNSEKRLFCGSGDTINKFKTQIKSRKRRLQREGGKKGHGILRSIKSYKKLQGYEANFIKTYNHKISQQVIDFVLKNNAGKIIIEDLNNGVKKDNKILLRNWSYYQLQQMIIYKAKIAGIKVEKIPPHYTSQTCSVCGHTDSANRDRRKFCCTNPKCKNKYKKDPNKGKNKVVDADYNAAKNIANGGLNCTPKGNEAVLTA